MPTNNSQLRNYLTQVHTALGSPSFNSNTPEDDSWKPEFAHLITLVHQLLTLADQDGKRVDFIEGVGVNGKIQDITSLINWLYDRLPELTADKPGQLASNRFNRYANQGWGYFANGCFFTVEFNDELAFFIDDQRVYLNRHIRRALSEVEKTYHLQS